MVTQFNFRLIVVYLLLFYFFNTILIGQDKMHNLNIDIKTAIKNYKENELKIIDITKNMFLIYMNISNTQL